MKFEDILSFVDEDLDTIYRRLDNIETLYDIYPITPHERQLVLQGFEVIHEKLKRIEKCKSKKKLKKLIDVKQVKERIQNGKEER